MDVNTVFVLSILMRQDVHSDFLLHHVSPHEFFRLLSYTASYF